MDNYKVDLIQVGEKYPQWVSPFEAFIQIHFRETYWELAIGYSNITKEEIHEFQCGDAQMASHLWKAHAPPQSLQTLCGYFSWARTIHSGCLESINTFRQPLNLY